MRADLPPDTQQSLDYTSTIDILRLLEGEEVSLFISGGAGVLVGNGEAASRIQAKGVLRHYAYGGWAEGFALGREDDDPAVRVGIGALQRLPEVLDQGWGESIAGFGRGEAEGGDAVTRLEAHRIAHQLHP